MNRDLDVDVDVDQIKEGRKLPQNVHHLSQALANKLHIPATQSNLELLHQSIKTEAIAARCSEFEAAQTIAETSDPNFAGKAPRFYLEDAQWRAEPAYLMQTRIGGQ